MIIPDKSIIDEDKMHRTEKYLRKRYPEFLIFLKNKYSGAHSIPEMLYLYFHNMKSHLDKRCKVCGNPVNFKNYNDGYHDYCSRKCTNNDSEILEKAQQARVKTNLERYGAECNFSNKESYEKCRKTWREKYGVDNPMKSKKVQDKSKQTSLKRYGVGCNLQSETAKQKSRETKKRLYGDEHYTNTEQSVKTQTERYGGVGLASPILKQKYYETCKERYGVEIPSTSPEIAAKVSKTKTNKVFDKDPNIISLGKTEEWFICKCPDPKCDKCGEKEYEIPRYLYHQRLLTGVDPCSIRTPLNGIKNTSLEVFIHEILDKRNISHIDNYRKILNGKEVDIYIPGKNLAIECNGIYWHSRKDSEYHYNKWKDCLDKGIQLLTFWEDQIYRTPEIVENILLSAMGIYEHKIGARECEIKKVPKNETIAFMRTNHLQGFVSGSEYMGLYYKNELVSMMVFGKKRVALGNKKSDKNTYELYRFCNKIGWQITGGASRLFKHFLEEHPGCNVESFSSNDISLGDLYKKLGFKKTSDRKSSYWYIDKQMNRYHRWTFRKDVLVKNGADPNLTEEEITANMELMRIYDSGQQKWIYKNQ